MTEQEEFLELYDRFRVKDQEQWYKSRSAEYRAADKQGYLLTQLLLFSAGVCGFIAALDISREVLGLVAALLAIVAGFITGWSELIGFRPNAELYDAATTGLAHARPDRFSAKDSPEATLKYVETVETILLGEVQAWTARWREVVAQEKSGQASKGGPDPQTESHPESS